MLGRSLVPGGSKAIKDLEKKQKSAATRSVRDNLDSALLDIATNYRDVLVVQGGSDKILNIDLKAEISLLFVKVESWLGLILL